LKGHWEVLAAADFFTVDIWTGCGLTRFAATGARAVRLPPQSPNLNPTRSFVRTVKESCLDRMILVGEASLRRALREFADHYQHERNHQSLDNRLIVPLTEQPANEAHMACQEWLGGLLKYYHRAAA